MWMPIKYENLFCTKIFGKHLVIVYAYNCFKPCHMSAQTLHVYEFTEIIKFLPYSRNISNFQGLAQFSLNKNFVI